MKKSKKMRQITINIIEKLIKENEHKIDNHYGFRDKYIINLKAGFINSLDMLTQIKGNTCKEIKYKLSSVTDEPMHPLRMIRVKLNLGQVDLAKMLNREQSTISKYELNKLDLSRHDFRILLAKLNVDINKLLDELDKFDIDYAAWEKMQKIRGNYEN